MAKKTNGTVKAGKDLSEFRASHDKSFIVPKKIQAGLNALGDGWEYEAEFLRICGISATDIGRFRDQFTDFFVSTTGHNPKRCWSGSKATIAKMQEMLNG